MPRTLTDHTKRQLVARLLSDPATNRLSEAAIAAKAGCSKGLVNVVKRLLAGRPTRGRQSPTAPPPPAQDRATDPRGRAAELVRELLSILPGVEGLDNADRRRTTLLVMLTDLECWAAMA